MKNLRKVFAVVIAIALVLTTMMPAFADASIGAEAKECSDLGFLVGSGANGVDAAYLAGETTRIQAAIVYLRLQGKLEEALNYTGTENFTDVASATYDNAKKVMGYLKANPQYGWAGNPDGSFNPNGLATPQMIYKVMLEGLGYKVSANGGEGYVKYANVLGFADALGMNEIAEKETITNNDLAIAIVEALGTYYKGTEVELIVKLADSNAALMEKAVAGNYVAVPKTAVAATTSFNLANGAALTTLTLPATVNVTYTDNTVVNDVAVTWDTTGVQNTVAGTYKVPGTIAGTSVKAEISIVVGEATFAVKSVTSTNLKEIYVEFNKDVDKKSIQTASNYTLDGGLDVLSAKIQGTNAVRLTLDPASGIPAQQQSVKVTLTNGIKDKAGNKLTQVTKKVTMLDLTLPTVTAVEATGTKTITVTFSEPMKTVPTFKLDSGSYYVNTSAFAAGCRSVDLSTGVALPVGEHSLTVSGGTDYTSTNKIVEETTKFNYNPDSSAISASIDTDSITQTSVDVVFNKEVLFTSDAGFAGDPADDSVTAYVDYNENTNYQASFDDETKNQAADTYTINFKNALPTGNHTLYVNVADSDLFEDKWGTDVASFQLTFYVEQDITKPTVASVTATDDSTIEVAFSEKVNAIDAENYMNYVFKNADGVMTSDNQADMDSFGHPVGATLDYDNTTKIVTITLTEGLEGGSYNLDIKNIQDQAPVTANKMAASSTAFAVTDTTSPTISKVVINADGDKMRVYFDEGMSTDGLTTLSNYRVNVGGTSKALWSTCSVAQVNSKTVEISLDQNSSKKFAIAAGNSLEVSGNVKDISGNSIGGFLSNATIVADTFTYKNKSAKATAKNKLTFTVTSELSDYDLSKIILSTDVAGLEIANLSYANGTGSSVVTLTLSKDLKSDLSDFNSLTIQAGGLTNTFDTTNAGVIVFLPVDPLVGVVNTSMQDKIVPSISTVKTKTPSTIDVTFSEKMKASTVSTITFEVAGNEVTDVTTGDDTTFTLHLDTDIATDAKPALTLKYNVQDDVNNVLAAGSSVKATADGCPADIKKAVGDNSADVTLADGATMNIVFTEALDTAGRTAVEDAIIAGAAATVGGAAAVRADFDFTWSGASLVVENVSGGKAELKWANDVAVAVTDAKANASAALTIINSAP